MVVARLFAHLAPDTTSSMSRTECYCGGGQQPFCQVPNGLLWRRHGDLRRQGRVQRVQERRSWGLETDPDPGPDSEPNPQTHDGRWILREPEGCYKDYRKKRVLDGKSTRSVEMDAEVSSSVGTTSSIIVYVVR